jgi:TM2 domain-containing membrane protein YozV
MKDKNIAALIAFIAGFVGAHHFYLGRNVKGFLYILGTCGAWFFTYKIMLIIAVFDGIRLLTMSPDEFDYKYNRGMSRSERKAEKRAKQEQRRSGWEDMERTSREEKQYTYSNSQAAQDLKKEGIEKYKAYDFGRAISAFEKVIISNPNDIATHFNLACCYSMVEDKTLAFRYLAKSVALGMKDLQKISTHDGLAYLRIQPEWTNFVANDYQEVLITTEKPPQSSPKPTPEPAQELNPLDALRQLYEQRQKGIIDESQFDAKSKELLS